MIPRSLERLAATVGMFLKIIHVRHDHEHTLVLLVTNKLSLEVRRPRREKRDQLLRVVLYYSRYAIKSASS